MKYEHHEHIERKIEERMSSWYLFLNEIFGVLGFGLALGTVGLDGSQFYASLVLVFLAILYFPEAIKRKRFIKLLREKKHPSLTLVNSMRAGAAYWFGFTFLLLVVLGVLNKDTTFSIIIGEIFRP